MSDDVNIAEGEVIEIKTGNIVKVRLSNLSEIEVAINKSLLRRIHKICIGDIFAIEIIESPKLSRAYTLIKRCSIE
jgi:translation initiation factor IF-1